MKGRLVKQFKEMGFRKIEGRKVELYSLYDLCGFLKRLKEMGIRKIEGKKLELYNYYTLCMFLDKLERGEKLN